MRGETDTQKNWNDYWKQQGINNRTQKHFPWKFLAMMCIISICVGQQIIRDKFFNSIQNVTNTDTSKSPFINIKHKPNPGTIDNQTNQYFHVLKNINLQSVDTITYLANSLNGEFDQAIYTEKVEETEKLYQQLTDTAIDEKYNLLKTQADNDFKKIIDYFENESKIKKHNIDTIQKIAMEIQDCTQECMKTVIKLFDDNSIIYEIEYEDESQTNIKEVSYRYIP